MATEKDFRDLRTDYNWGSLDEFKVKQNPFEVFADWYEVYSKTDAIDSTAVTVSTVDEDGQPDSRVVLLKEIRESRFIFYTNHSSKKGRDIARNPRVHLMFFWPEMERQIRRTDTKFAIECVPLPLSSCSSSSPSSSSSSSSSSSEAK